MQYIVATVVALIGFFILQNIDDMKADSNNQPRASTGKKLLMFLFVWLICLVLFHLLESSTGFFSRVGTVLPKSNVQNVATNGGTNSIDIANYPKIDADTIQKNMLRSIHEEVQVGRTPF